MKRNIWPVQPQVTLCDTQHTFNSIDSVRVTNDRVMLGGNSSGLSVYGSLSELRTFETYVIRTEPPTCVVFQKRHPFAHL